TTVILVLLVSLTRVVFSMARDGLLPRPLASMSRYQVPTRATLLAGGAAVAVSQTIDVLTLKQLVVMGSLFSFLFVSATVLALRRSQPDLHRPFRVPAAPFTAVVTIVAVAWLMVNLKTETWGYFGIWMAAGLVLYLVYGLRKSQMKLLLDEPPPERPAVRLDAPPPGALLPAPTDDDPNRTATDPPMDVRPRTPAPETPYPTGRYTSERQPSGQFAA